MELIKSHQRYLTEIDWLKSYHSFSFGDHYHPENKSWGNLRVINEDYISPGQGFGMHPHRDMEIITYIVSGSLEHQDSEANHGIISSTEVQRMSAGSGILHSEVNSSAHDAVHLLQIWVLPNSKGGKPEYAQKIFSQESKLNKLKLIISESGKEDSLSIKQNLDIYASILETGKSINLKPKHTKSWLQNISGQLKISDYTLNPGDALKIHNTDWLEISSLDNSHFLFFDIFN
jgi:quercetin 2,3-dioxygenase